MIALVLVLAVAAVIAVFVYVDPKRRMAVANIIGGLPLVWDGLMQFAGNFVGSAQQMELSHYVSPQYLTLYMLALVAIDAFVHMRSKAAGSV